jgi:pimeloyl-ACP methyl ester carboxylesterase
MGGYIALEFYRKYPKYVRALILANTQASVDSAKAKKGRDDNAALAREKGVPALAQKLMPKMLASITMRERPETVKSVSAMMSRQSVDGVVGALLAMRDRYDSMVTLKQISVPTLIITGLEDKLITSKKSELMRDMISGAKLVVLVDAGHLSNIDQPDAFNQAVNDFLSTVTL